MTDRQPRSARAAGRLAVRIASAAIVVLVVTATAAGAHDGEPEYIDEIDGYYVEASDEVIPATGLMYTLLLRDLDRGLPVDDAEVEITARAGERVVGPTSTVRFANAYSVLIPDDGQDEWTVDVRIDRPSRGVTTFSHTIVGISGDDGTVWWATPPALAVAWMLPVVLYFAYYQREKRRRARPAPDPPESGRAPHAA